MKTILEALKGSKTDQVPIWFMRQAGRYLPEYREVRKGKTFEDMVQNPDVAKEVTLQPINRFNLDAAIIFSDILVPLYALNCGLVIKPAQGPVIENPIKKPSDIDKLPQISPKEDFPYLAESIMKVKAELPNTTTLFGFSGAPFTVASYLLEGKSTRDALITKAFAYSNPEAYDKLLSFISDILIQQLKVQVEAGADVLQIFDSWANYFSPEQYEQFALPYTKKIIDSEFFKDVPIIHFAQGSGHLLPKYFKTGATGLSIDMSLDIASAMQKLPVKYPIQGNLDPAILLTNEKTVTQHVTNLLEKTKHKAGYIFNLGRGIDKDTPVENVQVMVDIVKSFNRE